MRLMYVSMEQVMVEVETKHGRMAAVRAFVTEYEWLHTLIAIGGNLLFILGSVMFIWDELKTYAIACFITGSVGMLIGNVGNLVVRLRRHRVR